MNFAESRGNIVRKDDGSVTVTGEMHFPPELVDFVTGLFQEDEDCGEFDTELFHRLLDLGDVEVVLPPAEWLALKEPCPTWIGIKLTTKMATAIADALKNWLSPGWLVKLGGKMAGILVQGRWLMLDVSLDIPEEALDACAVCLTRGHARAFVEEKLQERIDAQS